MPIRLAAVIAGLVALLGVLTLTIGSMLNGLQMVLPQEFALGIGLLPSNTALCTSAVGIAGLARWVFDVHAKILFEVVGGSLV